MSPELVAAGLLWSGLTLYALFGGADFGGGLLDLMAGGTREGLARRARIEHSVGPIWEANHVWLIFALVVFWTAFPSAFAPTMATLYMPLTAAAVGIILRGSAFAMRKAVSGVAPSRILGIVFALSSVITPFFLGTVAGAVASGRIPVQGTGDPVQSWVNPTSLLTGVIAVQICGFLAAVFICRDAERDGAVAEVEWFRERAQVLAVVAGVTVAGGMVVVAADAPVVADGLTGEALPVVAVSAAAGLASLILLTRRRFVLARLAAGTAVTAVMWAWGLAQYPDLLIGELTIEEAAGSRATLQAMIWSLGIGSIFFVPPLVWLLKAAQAGQLESEGGLEALASEMDSSDGAAGS